MKKRSKRFIAGGLALSLAMPTLMVGVAAAFDIDHYENPIEDILSQYELFTFGDVTFRNHLMGAFAIGGYLDADGHGMGDSAIVDCYVGNLLTKPNFATATHLMPDGQYYLTPAKLVYGVTTLDLSNNSKYVQNTEYIDMNKIFGAVNSESQKLAEISDNALLTNWHDNDKNRDSHTIDCTGDKDVFVTIEDDDFNDRYFIYFEDIDWFRDHACVISVTGIEDTIVRPNTYSEDFLFVEHSADGSNHYYNTDKILESMSGSKDGNQVNYDGMNLVWNFPDAVKMNITGSWAGHIVAPNASIVFEGGGNFEGGIIANSFVDNDYEGHFYPMSLKFDFGGDEEPSTEETTVETTVATTAETTAETTVATTAETTVETTAETTVATTAETTVETTVETTAETTVETTAETTVETTVATTAETTVETTAETTVETTAETTVAETTVETTAETTVAETTVETTAETTVAETTVETTAETTVAETTVETTAETTVTETTVETTVAPTTAETTVAETTVETTAETTVAPTTAETTVAPTTAETTVAPTTVETTVAPTTVVETTAAPESRVPETEATTTVEETVAPSTEEVTVAPTTVEETAVPESRVPEATKFVPEETTVVEEVETEAPETVAPTTAPETSEEVVENASRTPEATTVAETTVAETTVAETTVADTTAAPESRVPETEAPTTVVEETTVAEATTVVADTTAAETTVAATVPSNDDSSVNRPTPAATTVATSETPASDNRKPTGLVLGDQENGQLPITGKLVWPITACSLAGIAMIAYGIIDNRRRDEE